MKQVKQIITPSLYVFATEIEEAVKDGWKLDLENNPPVFWGITYEAGLTREIQEEPKLSRAEILAKARDAKAAKKAEAVGEGNE